MKKHFIRTLLCSLAAGSAALAEESPLLGRWRFDEGQGVSAGDVSLYQRSAQLVGATWTAGVSGGAVALDGQASYVVLPFNFPMGNNQFSVQLWVKPSPRPDAKIGYLAGEGGTWYVRLLPDHKVACGMELLDAAGKAVAYELTSTVTLADGAWSLLACQYDGKQLRLSLNGKPAGETAAAGTFSPERKGPVVLGTNPLELGQDCFTGALDEVRLQARVLTEAELLALYQLYGNQKVAATEKKQAQGGSITFIRDVARFPGDQYQKFATGAGKDVVFDQEKGFAVSLWVKIDEAQSNSYLFGIGGNTFIRFNGGGVLNFGVSTDGWNEVFANTILKTGEWHHVFCSYDGLRVILGLDGKVNSVLLLPGRLDLNGKPLVIGATAWDAKPSGNFKGELRDMTVYGFVMDYEALGQFNPDPKLHTLLQAAAAEALRQVNQQRESLLAKDAWLAAMLPKVLPPCVAPAELAVGVLKPTSPIPVLPDSAWETLPVVTNGNVYLAACAGQTEPASLLFRATREIANFTLKATDLTSLGGGVIPAEQINVKAVKVWYQDGNAWLRIEKDFAKKPIPELLLNDDSLVVTDATAGDNFLRTANGGQLWISEPRDRKTSAKDGSEFSRALFAVNDAPTLLPLTLAAQANKQFWLTVKVPENALPGSYVGAIRLLIDGQEVGRVPLAMHVLPFALETAKTRYDHANSFSASLYYWGTLDPYGLGRVGGINKSLAQLQVELTDLKDHGVTAPILIWPTNTIYHNPRLLAPMLESWQKTDFADKNLYFGDSGCLQGEIGQVCANVQAFNQMARAKYGVKDVYYYGVDEQRGEKLKAQRGNWKQAKDAGAKIVVSSFPGQFEAVGDLLDLCVWFGAPVRAEAAKWHQVKHKIWNYYNPQAGVENPDVNRRNYGLLLWQEDYDGTSPYCYIDVGTTPWNEFDHVYYRKHGFVYPTQNGVIGTLQWEGYREAANDVRYVSTLRSAIQVAAKQPAKAKLAQEAEAWLQQLDVRPLEVDLDDVRRTAIEYILGLNSH